MCERVCVFISTEISKRKSESDEIKIRNLFKRIKLTQRPYTLQMVRDRISWFRQKWQTH